MIAAVIAVLMLACGNTPVCTDAPLSDDAATALRAAAAQLDFVPRLPCTFDRAFAITSVFIDSLPGSPPQPRVHFVVTRRGERAFLLSETRASIPFSAIPLGSHWIRVSEGGVDVVGFAGPSGSGGDTAYLRWRTADVTFELAANLQPWLSEHDVQALATGLLRAQ
jgi:hypothetical protein